MGWIDTIIIVIIVAMGLMIMYKALKEPIDMLGRGISNLFGWGRDKVSANDYAEVISYG